MPRCRSTDTAGKQFEESTIQAVWQVAAISKEFPPLRVDSLGGLMFEHAYGVTNSKFGWEIDHRQAVAKGGGDELQNLQPLQWENNLAKGDD